MTRLINELVLSIAAVSGASHNILIGRSANAIMMNVVEQAIEECGDSTIVADFVAAATRSLNRCDSETFAKLYSERNRLVGAIARNQR